MASTPNLNIRIQNAVDFDRKARGVMSRAQQAAIESIGLVPEDVVCACDQLRLHPAIYQVIKNNRLSMMQDATLIMLQKPVEKTIIKQANRLKRPVRLVVFNNLSDIENMPQSTFDMATAVLFDQNSDMVVRIYDALPRRISEYLHIEIDDHNDVALSAYVSRIASLR